jgi:TIR domain/YEATS family
MTYRIGQDEHYLGHDRWKWSAWIDASPNELDQVKEVTWILHPTFNPSRVVIRSRENNFRLDTSGWGTFSLRARIQLETQPDALVVSRMLKLTYPDDEGSLAPEEGLEAISAAPIAPGRSTHAPTIFLSYSSEDKLQALKVRSTIERLGGRVLDASGIGADLPFQAAIRKMIRESDGLMSVVGSDYVSPIVLSDMKLAQSEDKPMVTMLPENVTLPSDLPHDIQSVRLGNSGEVSEVGLAEFVRKLQADA